MHSCGINHLSQILSLSDVLTRNYVRFFKNKDKIQNRFKNKFLILFESYAPLSLLKLVGFLPISKNERIIDFNTQTYNRF